MGRDVWIAIVLFVGAVGVYWVGNGATSLWDRDEPRFAQPAKEMLFAEGIKDYIIPRHNGQMRFHKPPLSYWQIVGAYKVFGVNEFSARAWSGVFTAAAVVVMFYFGRRWSRRVAVVSAVSLATSVLVIGEAKLARADGALLFCTVLSVLLLWRMYEGRGGKADRVVFWMTLGIAGLVKGPAILVVVVPLAVGLIILDTDRAWVGNLGLAWGPVLMCAMALPWYVVADCLSNGELRRVFLWSEVIERIRQSKEGHRGWPGFYVVVGLASVWPWSAFLAPLAVTAWQRRSEKILGFVLCWLIVPTVALELIATKMIQYWHGVVPAYCLLLGLSADHWLADPRGMCRRWWPVVRAVVLGGFAAAGAVLIVLGGLMPAEPIWSAVVGGQLIIAAAVLGYVAAGRSLTRMMGVMGACSVVFAVIVWSVVLPGVERLKISKQLANRMTAAGGTDATYVLAAWAEDSTIFYLHDGVDDVIITSPAKLATMQTPGPLVAAVAARVFDKPAMNARLLTRFNEVARVKGWDYTQGRWREMVVLRNTEYKTQNKQYKTQSDGS